MPPRRSRGSLRASAMPISPAAARRRPNCRTATRGVATASPGQRRRATGEDLPRSRQLKRLHELRTGVERGGGVDPSAPGSASAQQAGNASHFGDLPWRLIRYSVLGLSASAIALRNGRRRGGRLQHRTIGGGRTRYRAGFGAGHGVWAQSRERSGTTRAENSREVKRTNTTGSFSASAPKLRRFRLSTKWHPNPSCKARQRAFRDRRRRRIFERSKRGCGLANSSVVGCIVMRLGLLPALCWRFTVVFPMLAPGGAP